MKILKEGDLCIYKPSYLMGLVGFIATSPTGGSVENERQVLENKIVRISHWDSNYGTYIGTFVNDKRYTRQFCFHPGCLVLKNKRRNIPELV